MGAKESCQEKYLTTEFHHQDTEPPSANRADITLVSEPGSVPKTMGAHLLT